MSDHQRAAQILRWVSGYVLDRSPEPHEIPSPAQFSAFVPLVHVSTRWIVGEHDLWKEDGEKPPHPLEKAVRAWLAAQAQTDPNQRPDRILPARLGMVVPTHPHAGNGLFMPATRADGNGQLILPGFANDISTGPALPHELYELGAGRGTRYTPLALRIWVEGVLCVPLEYRGRDQPVSMSLPFREFFGGDLPRVAPTATDRILATADGSCRRPRQSRSTSAVGRPRHGPRRPAPHRLDERPPALPPSR